MCGRMLQSAAMTPDGELPGKDICESIPYAWNASEMARRELLLLWTIYFLIEVMKYYSGIKTTGSPFARAAMIERQEEVYECVVKSGDGCQMLIYYGQMNIPIFPGNPDVFNTSIEQILDNIPIWKVVTIVFTT